MKGFQISACVLLLAGLACSALSAEIDAKIDPVAATNTDPESDHPLIRHHRDVSGYYGHGQGQAYGPSVYGGQYHQPAVVRRERAGLLDSLGLPLNVGSLVTELLIGVNNLLAKFDITVLILPAPLPIRVAKCIPGCFQNPDCVGAILSVGSGGDPLSSLLGILNG